MRIAISTGGGMMEVLSIDSVPLHMDGARFANALVSLGCTPADITWRAGVDLFRLNFSHGDHAGHAER